MALRRRLQSFALLRRLDRDARQRLRHVERRLRRFLRLADELIIGPGGVAERIRHRQRDRRQTPQRRDDDSRRQRHQGRARRQQRHQACEQSHRRLYRPHDRHDREPAEERADDELRRVAERFKCPRRVAEDGRQPERVDDGVGCTRRERVEVAADDCEALSDSGQRIAHRRQRRHETLDRVERDRTEHASKAADLFNKVAEVDGVDRRRQALQSAAELVEERGSEDRLQIEQRGLPVGEHGADRQQGFLQATLGHVEQLVDQLLQHVAGQLTFRRHLFEFAGRLRDRDRQRRERRNTSVTQLSAQFLQLDLALRDDLLEGGEGTLAFLRR